MGEEEARLDMLSRHVLRGREHVRRQKEIVDRLERAGAWEELRLARELLSVFEATQEAHERHLTLAQRENPVPQAPPEPAPPSSQSAFGRFPGRQP